MDTTKSLLAGLHFFKGLKPEHLDLATRCATDRIFKPDQFLFHEGEAADVFFIIRSGRVQIEVFSHKRGPITIQTIDAGEIVGWSWMVPPYCWRFDARATEPTSVIAIDGKCLREMCEKDHSLGYELMKSFALVIAERLEATRLQLLDVYGK